MKSYNKCILIGKVATKPLIRMNQKGNKIVYFNLATFEEFKTPEGRLISKTHIHPIVVTSFPLAELCEKHLREGLTVCLDGSIKTAAPSKTLETNTNNTSSSTPSSGYQIVVGPFNSNLIIGV